MNAKVEVEVSLLESFMDFLDRFEQVFHGDWEHTKSCLADEIQQGFISEIGSFINPGVDDEANDWGNRAAILEAYRALKLQLAALPNCPHGCYLCDRLHQRQP